MLVAAIVVAFLYFNQESNFQIETGTFNDYFFGSGISMLDRQGESFNYQIVSTNPYEFGTLILKHWKYYIKRIPLFYSNVWTYSRIYYVPFLSEKYTTTENWLFNILSYMNTLIVWIFLFVSLWGLKKMIIDLRTSTAIIWIPILTVPFIVSVFAHNQRYIFVLIYSTIPCIAYGISYCQNLKGYLFISGLLIITLIALVNLSLPIALSIIGVSLIFVFKKYLLFQKV